MEAFDKLGVRRLPRLGHDGDVPARHHGQPARRSDARTRSGRTGSPRAVSRPASRPGWSAPAATGCPGTASRPVSWRCAAPGSRARTTAVRAAKPLRPEDKFSEDGWLKTGDVGVDQPRRLPHPHRPRQGRHQVRRRVDLQRRPGERADGPPGRRRGRRRRRPGREVGRASARDRRPQGRRHRRLRDPAGVPRRAGIAKWQLPERWTIIESVPKTSVGKFDKKVIRKQYADGELDVTQL